MSDELERVPAGSTSPGGKIYTFEGHGGVMLEVHIFKDGQAAFATWSQHDTDSQCYGLKLSQKGVMALATLLVDAPPPGVGVN